MSDSISDIEVLALQCRSENSKLYVEEATRCYRAGAYRAAIVSTWIAVVFDLVDKIRELSVSGDANALLIHERFEAYLAQIDAGNDQGVKNALEFERTILKTCRDSFQLFDQHQFIDLERLRDDRHRCAHPSFQRLGQPYQPSAEQARLHIRNAVHHVLALLPIQGKAALATLRTLVASQYFPLEADKAAILLKASPLGRPTPSLLRGFIDMLVFEGVTVGRDLFAKAQVGAALGAAFNIFPAAVEPRVVQQLGKAIIDVPDAQLPFAIAMLTHVRWAWDGLSVHARDKVTRFIEHGEAKDVIPGLESLHRIAGLTAAVQNRINRLDLEDLSSAIEHGVGALARERALLILSEVRSWTSANEVISQAIVPLLEYLTEDDLLRIVTMPKQTGADLFGSHAFSTLLKIVAINGKCDRDKLRASLNESGGGFLIPLLEEAEQSI